MRPVVQDRAPGLADGQKKEIFVQLTWGNRRSWKAACEFVDLRHLRIGNQ